MIVGARQGGSSISETADLLGFSRTVSIVCREWCEKHPVSSSVGKNGLLLREVRGKGPDWKKTQVMQVTSESAASCTTKVNQVC